MAWRLIETAPSPEEEMEIREALKEVHTALLSLKDEEIVAVGHAYGFAGQKLTLKQIGDILNVNAERARQRRVFGCRKIMRKLGEKRCLEIMHALAKANRDF